MMAPRVKALKGGAKQTFEWLPVGELVVDSSFQRPLDLRRVERIAREFDPDLVGVFTVSRRDSGVEVVLDGQHRQAAILSLWGDDERVPCQVFHGLTHEREAEIFAQMNVRRVRPHTIDVYLAMLEAKDPEVCAVDAIVRAHGLTVDRGKNGGSVRAPETLRRIFRALGGEMLAKVLDLCVKAGYADEEPLPGEIVLGVAVVLSRYRAVIDEKRLAKVLEANTARRLLGSARSLRAEVSVEGDVGTTVGRILWDRYNRNRRVAGRFPWIEVGSTAYWNAFTVERLSAAVR